MPKRSVFSRLVSITVAFAMILSIGGSALAADVGDITLGTPVNVSVTSSSNDWYTFTPTVTGQYTLKAKRTTATGQRYGTIAYMANPSRNGNWTNALQNIYTTEVENTLTLTAGTTYGFRTRNSSSSTYSYTYTLSAAFATISFDGNGSTSTMQTVYPTLNQAYTLPACTMTREGFEFAGWATSATGDVVYADQASITPTADMTLYAKWNENREIEVTATGYDGPYDGNYHTIDVNVTTPSTGYTIEYRETTTGEWSGTAPTYTTGTHTVYYRVTAEGYAEVTGSENVVISEATISYTASNYNAGYDGQPHSIIVNVTEPATGYTIEYSSSQYGPWSTTAPTVTNPNTSARRVYFRISAPGYATTAVDSRTIRVTTGTIDYTAEGYTGAYDGQAHGISITVNAPASGYTIQYRTSTYGQWSYNAPTYTTGNHTVNYRIQATNYTTVTGSATVNITAGEIAYTADGYSGTYDGSTHSISVSVTTPATGATIEYSESESGPWSTTPVTRTDAGTTTVYFRISANNYETVVDSATVEITDAEIAYTASGYTGTYDGQAHGITVNVTEPEGATVMYSETATGPWSTTPVTRTDVGSTTVYYQISADNYETVTGHEAVVINEGTITYTADGYTGSYDGQPHSISIDVTDPVSGVVIEYRTNPNDEWSTTNPEFTDVGTHTVYYRLSATGYATKTGSVNIVINPGTIVYNAANYTGTYDGQAHSISVTVTTPASGATIQYREQGHRTWRDSVSFTNAGTYTVEYRIQAANYETVTGSATVNIDPAAIDYSAQGYSGTYDGQDHTISVSVSAPANAQIRYRNAQGRYTLTNPPTYSAVGTYLVYYRITANNYETVESSATVEITAADMTVTVAGYSAPYDGAAHGIEVEVTTPASGATVLYGESADACTLTTCPTYSYGEHTVYFVVSADNYNDYTGSATVSISDIDIAATAEGYDGPYDGEAHGITVTVTEPESGASVMFGTEEGTYDMEVSPVFTEIGDYTVYYQVTAEGHNPLTGSATVSIGELTIDATVTPYDGVFDGAEHGVTVTVNTPEVGATVLFGTEAGVYDLDESPTYCEIGTYTVYYRITAEYYAPLEGSVVVRISENPDRDDAREALIELIAASDEILDEWEDLLPEDLVEALLDAEDAAYDVLNNEIASIEQLEAAADNLANALGSVLQYIAENYETEPELTPEQRTRLCVINFVENLYLHALGRPFDVSGRDTWVSLIMDQGGTGTQVARGFLGSQEFLGLGLDNEGFVKALYNALFNRVPEAEEVDTWTNALAAGVTREEVINAFFASPEWARTCAYYRVNI